MQRLSKKKPQVSLKTLNAILPAETSGKTERVLVFGVRPNAFIHWMRDQKFTRAEMFHVLKRCGFVITNRSAGGNTLSIWGVRAHLHCKCVQKDVVLKPGDILQIDQLRAEVPLEVIAAEKADRRRRVRRGLPPAPAELR